MLTLYSTSNKKKLDLTPSHSDTLTREIMGDAVISLSFVHWEYIPIEVGDYVVWEGERFTILSRQFPLQVSSMEWRYQLKLLGESARLKRYHVLSPDGDPIFTLTSPASEHLRLIVEAMNECEGGKEWKVGSVVATDNLVVDYNCTTLDAALQIVADAAHTEWWVEGKTLHLTRCEWGEALPLAYGEGLTSLEQGKADGHKVYTRIYPIGSSRNIDSATYGAARLQLPDKAKFVDLPAIQELGRIDHYERDAFSHIYPRRIGTITSMRKEQRKVEGKDMEVYFVKDDSLNFDPADHLMSGKVMQFSFQEGADLAGRDFECNWHAAQREFELITQWLGDGTTQLPNASLPPKVGDRYLLWNIKMPDSYLRDAEQELLQAVQAYNEKHHLDLSVYKARTDFEYFERHDVKLRLGQRVTLSSKEFFADGSRASRVSKIVQHLDCSSMMDIEMSDTLSKGVLQRINDEVGRVEQQVRRVEATLPEILRIGDPSPATDNNIYSAARTHREFLSKNKDDVAHGHITFSKGATFGSYLPSLIGGSGAKIDERGNAEVESIKVRSRMEVAELVVNRQTTMDADILLTEGDTVEEVNVEKSGDYTLALKREWEGYVTSLTAGAVVRGIYNDITRGGGTFETTWLKVVSVDSTNNAIRVSLYPNSDCPARVNYAPRPLLRISRWGHVSDELRQATYLLSSRDQRIALLTNVTKPIIDASNISSWQGKLDGLTWRDAGGQTHQLTGYGNVMGDAYVSGSLHIGGQLTGAIADKVNEIVNDVDKAKRAADDAKAKLAEIEVDALRDSIISDVEGKALAKAKLELLKSEKSYLLARADAVLAAHPQLATTHPTEYNQIREGSASNQNARWNYLLYAEGMINACEAFLAGNSSYIFNGGSKPTATRYEDLFSLWLSSKSLSEWYEFSRNNFEAAIIMADRSKDGRDGADGQPGRDATTIAVHSFHLDYTDNLNGNFGLKIGENHVHHLLSRGLRLLSIDPKSYEIETDLLFDTYATGENGAQSMADAIENIPVGKVVVIYTWDAFHCYPNLINALVSIGATKIRQFNGFRVAYALIGQKGLKEGEAAEDMTMNSEPRAAICSTYLTPTGIVHGGAAGRDGTDGRDAKPPRVSAGGTWEVWSWEQNAYIDTNDPARGESGENGLAPRINSSGYWEVYENGVWRQTSTKAKGKDGKKGDSGLSILSIKPLYLLTDSDKEAPELPISPTDRRGWKEEKPPYSGSGQWHKTKIPTFGSYSDDARKPRVNNDGYWEVWNASENRYQPTFHLFRGENEFNRLAPRKDDNGYWEVWDSASFLWRCEEQTYGYSGVNPVVDIVEYTSAQLDSEWSALKQSRISGQNLFGFGRGIIPMFTQLAPEENGTQKLFTVKTKYVERPKPKKGSGNNLYGFRIEVEQIHRSQKDDRADSGGLYYYRYLYHDYRQHCALVRLAKLGLTEVGDYAVSFKVRANRKIEATWWRNEGHSIEGEATLEKRPTFYVNLCDNPETWFTPTEEWQEVKFVTHTLIHVGGNPKNDPNHPTDPYNLEGFLDIEIHSGVMDWYPGDKKIDVGGYLLDGDWLEFKDVMIERGNTHTEFKPSLDYLTQLLSQPAGIGDGIVFGGRIDAQQNGQTKAFLNGVNLEGVPFLAAGNIDYDPDTHLPESADVEIWANGHFKFGDKLSWNGENLNVDGIITAEEMRYKVMPFPSNTYSNHPAQINTGTLFINGGGFVEMPYLERGISREVRFILTGGQLLRPVVKDSRVKLRLDGRIKSQQPSVSFRFVRALGVNYGDDGNTYWYIHYDGEITKENIAYS